MKKLLLILVLAALALANAFSQIQHQTEIRSADGSVPKYKYSISTTYLSFLNFEMGEVPNTYHYELHMKHRLSPKEKIGIKLATWNMFEPMGMPMEEVLKFDEENYYPGRVRETGLGVTYQRFIWKGLFVTAEILPQLKTYLDEDNHKLNNGFKLYTSYHLGYQIPLFKNRVYVEPQIHCQYWPIDTNTPQAFKVMDDKWNNYFLFEPDLYLGLNFNY